MAPSKFCSLLEALKYKFINKSNPEISITDEEKVRWQKLIQKCKEDKLIDEEEFPPSFDKHTENLVE